MTKLKNVLSLFDGMSCGQIALNKNKIQYDVYYASEIDKFPIKVTQENFPNTIQLGDVTKWKEWDIEWQNVDLLMAGFPCQSWSLAGKEQGDKDPRGQLMWVMLDILNHIRSLNPNVKYLFENVKMKKVFSDYINKAIGVEPVELNSRLVSAQERKRLYWTNLGEINHPEDLGIKFCDITEDGWYCGGMRGRRINPITKSRNDNDKSIPIRQYIEAREDDKSNCLTTVAKDNVAVRKRVSRELAEQVEYRYLTAKEYEILQTVPLGYTSCVSDSQRRKILGNGWTVDIIAHILKNILVV